MCQKIQKVETNLKNWPWNRHLVHFLLRIGAQKNHTYSTDRSNQKSTSLQNIMWATVLALEPPIYTKVLLASLWKALYKEVMDMNLQLRCCFLGILFTAFSALGYTFFNSALENIVIQGYQFTCYVELHSLVLKFQIILPHHFISQSC